MIPCDSKDRDSVIGVQLSRFDPVDGPKPMVFYSDKMLDETVKEKVADLIDNVAAEADVFLHSFERYNIFTLNKIITVNSQQARGKRESILASVILDHLPSQKLREFIVERLHFLDQDITTHMPDVANIFYLHRDTVDDERQEIYGIYSALLTQIQMMHYDILNKKVEVPPYEDYVGEPKHVKKINQTSQTPQSTETPQSYQTPQCIKASKVEVVKERSPKPRKQAKRAKPKPIKGK